MRFKLFEKVIVTQNGINKLGLLLNRSVKNKKTVFDVRLETGSEISYVTVDKKEDSIYINSYLTKKFANLINSNLNVLNKGNIRK